MLYNDSCEDDDIWRSSVDNEKVQVKFKWQLVLACGTKLMDLASLICAEINLDSRSRLHGIEKHATIRTGGCHGMLLTVSVPRTVATFCWYRRGADAAGLLV